MKKMKYEILINKTSEQFSDRGFECMLAVVLALGSIFLLMFFPVIGFALVAFLTPFFFFVVKRYLLSITTNSFLPIESIFTKFNICIKAFCLKVATSLISILWGVIFIIPGIVSMLNYSMAGFILAEDEKLSSLECMIKSKKLVYGYRTEIFIIYLSYFLVTVITACVFSAIGIAMQTFFNTTIWPVIVSMLVAFLFVLIIFIIPYYELMFANVYLVLKQSNIIQKKSKAKTTNKTNDENVE